MGDDYRITGVKPEVVKDLRRITQEHVNVARVLCGIDCLNWRDFGSGN